MRTAASQERGFARSLWKMGTGCQKWSNKKCCEETGYRRKGNEEDDVFLYVKNHGYIFFKVFPDKPAVDLDISNVIATRVEASRKLQNNPNDVEAMTNLFNVQQKVVQFVESDHWPLSVSVKSVLI